MHVNALCCFCFLRGLQYYTLACPNPECKYGGKCKNAMILYDDRDFPDEGLGYILCSHCANDFIPKSGYPPFSRKKKFGWRSLPESELRMYLESEWKGNIHRTRSWLREMKARPRTKKRKRLTGDGGPCVPLQEKVEYLARVFDVNNKDIRKMLESNTKALEALKQHEHVHADERFVSRVMNDVASNTKELQRLTKEVEVMQKAMQTLKDQIEMLLQSNRELLL